jgi:hypothetical protein
MQSSWPVVVAAGKPFWEAAEVMLQVLEQLLEATALPLPGLQQMAPMGPVVVEPQETTVATLESRDKHGLPVALAALVMHWSSGVVQVEPATAVGVADPHTVQVVQVDPSPIQQLSMELPLLALRVARVELAPELRGEAAPLGRLCSPSHHQGDQDSLPVRRQKLQQYKSFGRVPGQAFHRHLCNCIPG